MSTLKSSAEDLTLNADGSGNDIKFQSNAVEKASLSDAGLLTTSGGASLDGAVTINETGADVDFRVEGSGEANALFVQGSDGYLGLGTDEPARPLHIKQLNTWAQVRLERHTNNAGIAIIGAGDDEFKVADSAYALRLTVATDTGDTTIKTGNLVIGTAGKGIDFSADSDAGGMTSELLDDYEAGTFTPTLYGTSTAGSPTYGYQLGNYTKVGNIVNCFIRVTTSALGGIDGSVRIGGLPFTSSSQEHNFSCGTASYGAGLAITAGTSVSGWIQDNNTYIKITNWDGDYGTTYLDDAEWSDNGTLMLSVTYHT